MEQLLKENKAWIDSYWDKTVAKLRKTTLSSRYKLPRWSVDGVYDDRTQEDVGTWTNAFWPGINWLMYYATGENDFRTTAEISEKLLDEALKDYLNLTHDAGFLWLLSACANYRITGNEDSKNRALHAAASLASRYNLAGQFIKAWPGEHAGYVIIDCMMNIPLLYWAAKEADNVAFKQIAMSHADTCLKNHIRPDGSVNHVVDYDIHTGECLGPAVHGQGYNSQWSCWTRGQSWAIYGYTLSYLHTGEQRYLDAAKKVAHYFIAAAAARDYVVSSDFRAPDQEQMDSSAAAIAACGLIEIAKVVPEYEKKMYMTAALKLMKKLCETQCDFSDDDEAIVKFTTGSYNTLVHVSYIFGDYFFVEALCKLKGCDILLW